ncbi:MAG TPA: glutamine amidotransferase [Verrucomicrobiae bacterium]|nr:glutamine amidotransferase [Verrucomicrobiae bacterium]
MSFQFSNPIWLLALIFAVPWVVWLSWKSDVRIEAWRHWSAMVLRLLVVLALCLGMAGLQFKKPMEGLTVFFMLDRSQSVPSPQQESARVYVNQAAAGKKPNDLAGVLVFGADAAIETRPNTRLDLRQFQAVVGTERTDIASAIRLGTAAFPETGQKRLVLLSDGNENVGDALSALAAARTLGVSMDVLPLGASRGNDVSIQKLTVPSNVKKGQTFDVKIFAQADHDQSATIRLYLNETPLGEQKVQLNAGKNLLTFPQTLDSTGFYKYDVQVDAPGDTVPQNNRGIAFATVRGNPRVLIISSDPKKDQPLVAALQNGKLEVKVTDRFPDTLAELQSYDAIFLSNISAGDLGLDSMRLLESAVRDFGVGLVCIGGDETYAAGGYRGTPLEAMLPVEMELSSKKVLPNGALAIVCHATEFPGGNGWARDIAYAALDALGPQDEMGIVLWDGNNHWLFPLSKVGNKTEMGRKIGGMNPGDMPGFEAPMQSAYDALVKSTASLKHMIVFSDGDPSAPSKTLVQDIVNHRITISTVMIGGHVAPDTMSWLAAEGHGRFWAVDSASDLPQIFIKEASVILKSAIFEEPFKPQVRSLSEVIKGISPQEYPQLLGYVCTTPKGRAEVPLVTQKGDPLLAHWQYGLGRTVAFTSDARAKWAVNWIGWDKYRQFWLQVAQWSLRRLDAANFNTEVAVEKGEGHVSVEAIDSQGHYRNFLNLQLLVVSPKGDKQVLQLEQTGAGRYDAVFPTKEVGAYLMNLTDRGNGQSEALGLSVNYSPEFDDTGPNLNFLRRLAELGGGKVLDPQKDNPFTHDRVKTFQPFNLRDWLLEFAILLFPLDVAVRRIQLDRSEWLRATNRLRRWIFFWKGVPRTKEADESLSALLTRRGQVRSERTAPAPSPSLFEPEKPVQSETPAAPAPGAPPGAPASAEKPPAQGEGSTTGRLLDAKRRAQKRTDRE